MLHSLNGSLHVGIHSLCRACYYEFSRVIPLSSSFFTVSLLSVYYGDIIIDFGDIVNIYLLTLETFS